MLLFLLACDNPISNAVFLADGDFLDALPSPTRMGFPANLRAITSGDEPMLAFGGRAAADLLPVTSTMITIGDIFRSTEPEERSPTSRRYAARPITLEDSDVTWWMRADFSRSTEAGPIQWTIEGATADTGPWEPIATGRHAPDGVGSFTWHTPAVADLAQLDDDTPLAEVEYQDRNQDGLREVSITFPIPFALPVAFGFVGDVAFGFTGRFDIDPAAEPTDLFVTLFARPDQAGFAEGILLQDDQELPFRTCWNSQGNRTFAEGPDVIGPTGDAASCLPL